MQIARVLGTATATVKHRSLEGQKLLLVQPLGVGERADGLPLLVVDSLGAGRGETVVITSDGRATRALVNDNNTPARWSVIGVRDA